MKREHVPFLMGGILGGLVIFLMGIVVGAVATGRHPPGGSTIAAPAAKYTRADFSALVIGKTPEEVIKAVGRPDGTQESGSEVNWYYQGRTYDPVTNNPDFHAQVLIRNGVITRVNY